MKSVFLENKGHYHTRVNGNVIDQAKWNVDYDGKTANLEAEKNGETVYMKLTNDDIMKLMSTDASPHSIEERLLHDKQHMPDVSPILLKMHYRRNKKSKSKGTKSKKHSRTKTSKSKTSKSKTSKSKTSKSKTSKSKTRKQRLSKTSKSKSKSKPSKFNETIPDYMRTIY
jgi:hypothetical protein